MIKKIKYEICRKKNINELKRFIHLEWKKNHILSKNKNVIEWFYGNNNQINFVLAKYQKKIIGVLGFIPNFQFDIELKKNQIIWLALWKVKKDNRFNGVGLGLLNFLQKKFRGCAFGCNGINNKVEKIYKLLNYKSFYLNHYYFINSSMEQKVIKKKFKIKKFKEKKSFYKIKKINKEEIKKIKFPIKHQNKKSPKYFINRYFECRFFKYIIFGIFKKNNLKGIFSTKIQNYKASKILRIIDYYGDITHLRHIKSALQKTMIEFNIEYTDFYNFGIKDSLMKRGGFIKNNFNKKIVVPNYFYPFKNKNIKIRSVTKNINSRLLIYKGDGDQDMPH